ncbi:MAG: hypothetical protein U1D25_18910 [Hydrogenophaga sp.]|uniref:hypothetical protein n=1 Tax=Hydrogenophaga sp. TaxID=1904254 RepID=UPI002730190D|nr:hypothetical protein [Hydrogenophaga sp.]MDP2408080.1 hypothetical protein [Hydrogenophaga sp.]MDZ4190157.1 hypothetical protein [Hydrogenophaga sp.]
MTKYIDTQVVEALCEKNWESSAAIRTEFSGNKAAYKAYWCAVAKGQTPPPREPKAARSIPAASVAPAVTARTTTNQPSSVARIAQGQSPSVGNYYSVLSRVRAFHAVNPVEAKKQYPQQVKQIEEAKGQDHV